MPQGSIRKRGGTYYKRYRVGGKLVERAVGPTRREAEQSLTETMRDLNRGQYVELKEITFAEFAPKWLETSAEGRVRPTTLKSYRDTLRLHLVPFFGHRKLISIRTRDVDEYLASKRRSGKYAPASIAKHLMVLKMLMKQAIIWDYAAVNPAEHVKPPRTIQKEVEVFSPLEIQAFLEAASPEYRPFFTTAVLTGLRLGELLGLKWSDINFRTSQIHVRRAYVLEQFTEPKTRAGIRAVVMAPSLVSTLKRHQLKSPPGDLDLVFATEEGKPLNGSNMRQREFHSALRRAKLHRIRFHDLRHTYASLLIAAGENLKFISSQLGHSSIQVTIDRYGHLIPAIQHGAGERLEKLVFGSDVGKMWAKPELSTTPPEIHPEEQAP